jgi:hypothetical protein
VGGCTLTPTALATGQGPTWVTADSTNVYWIATGSTWAVRECASAGCSSTPTTLASGGFPAGLTVDSTNVYWTNFSGAIDSCAIAGCSSKPTALVIAPGNAIALDGTDLYFVSNGNIDKCAKGGCSSPTALTTGFAGANRIANDATAVYWTSFGSGAILKVAK